MELVKVTEKVYYYPFEKERDRPILGYVKGEKDCLAIDAGHSRAHTLEFYAGLEKAGLPLPSVTVLTHWHWDHSFGMWATNGKCISNEATMKHLMEFKKWYSEHGTESFLSLDECIRKEYSDLKNNPVIITVPDILFNDEMLLDVGNCPIRLLQTESPHTDDSTLILIEKEKVLFIGDAAGGVFPTWEKDPVLCNKLADTLSELDFEICLESHHFPQTKQEIIDDLRSV